MLCPCNQSEFMCKNNTPQNAKDVTFSSVIVLLLTLKDVWWLWQSHKAMTKNVRSLFKHIDVVGTKRLVSIVYYLLYNTSDNITASEKFINAHFTAFYYIFLNFKLLFYFVVVFLWHISGNVRNLGINE